MTFEEFSEMNRRRCESWHGFGESLQPESKYTLAHWALSISSEVGEVCDAILGFEGLKKRRAGKTKEDIAKELADVITYCDLAIQKLGYDTGTILAQKFNEVNARLDDGKRFHLAGPREPTPAEGEACDYTHNGTPCRVRGPHEYHLCGGTKVGPLEPLGPREPTPASMLLAFRGIRALPYRVARYRPDGWPICPVCDEDELASLTVPATPATISLCYRCGQCEVLAGPREPTKEGT